MYLLAIDIGNTHTEIGLYLEQELQTSWRVTTGLSRTEDELMAYLHYFLLSCQLTPERIDDLAISSVVPSLTAHFVRLTEKYFRNHPFIVDHTVDLGIDIAYQPPSAVGADRLCNAVAAFEKFGGPAVVVDLGTATTLDVIDARGCYRGGAIAPGLETSAWGLHERASKLPSISLEYPRHTIGRTTEESMQSGIVLGTVKMIDGLIEEIEKELQATPVVVATGGLAGIVAKRSRYIQYVEPNLVLEGLMRVYFRNRGR